MQTISQSVTYNLQSDRCSKVHILTVQTVDFHSFHYSEKINFSGLKRASDEQYVISNGNGIC